MKKEDSSKTPEALTAQKELNAYVQRKIQIMELETNSIVDQAKQEITKEISLRKEDIIKTIEERTRISDIRALEERERKIKLFHNIIHNIKVFFLKEI